MFESHLLTMEKLFQFYNRHRLELRAMPLSQQLNKIFLVKVHITPEVIYDITKQLLNAEKNATSKQKSVFKNIQEELNIPYQEAKELDKNGKLTRDNFIELLKPKPKNIGKPPSDKPLERY